MSQIFPSGVSGDQNEAKRRVNICQMGTTAVDGPCCRDFTDWLMESKLHHMSMFAPWAGDGGLIWLPWPHKGFTRPFNFHSIMFVAENHNSLVIVHYGGTAERGDRRIWSHSIANLFLCVKHENLRHVLRHTLSPAWTSVWLKGCDLAY